MEEKVRVAVIGAGMGTSHIRGFLKRTDKISVVAAADLEEERTAKIARMCRDAGAPAPKLFTDYRKMLELDEIEIVVIATPNHLHAPMAVACLEAGKHIIIEKPPSNTLAGAQQILDAVRKTGGRCMIGVNNRFRTEIGRLKAIIERGDFGDVYFAKTGWMRRHGIPIGSGSGWFVDKERAGGGPLIDIGVHVLDLTWWLMGCPKPVAVTGATYDPFIREIKEAKASVEDFAAGFIRFANGASIFVEVSWAGHTDRERGYSTLFGTGAGVDIDLMPMDGGRVFSIHTTRDGDWLDVTMPQYDQVDWQPVLADQLLYFAECVRGGKPNMANIDEGLDVMRMLSGLYESAEKGKEVRLGTSAK
ncbi:MAG: Gfo/Idh/MocA family oxidoreductase [Verrucomicrobia bacterium]|nr:Gfo/Idh/MocA family oxidoreductase [Verrucomicrobiota bacterium]